MKTQRRIAARRKRRLLRVRSGVRRSAGDRPRLSVFRTNKHMYAQIIDDAEGHTLVAASTVEKELFGCGRIAGNKSAAAKVGTLLAKRALEQKINQVVFDRGLYKYHGRVAALADAAREAGLQF